LSTLYVAASPLGNLGDISQRLTDVLRDSVLVAAEDTRRARKLLNHVNAHPRVLSFHAHSPPKRTEQILAALDKGSSVVMLTDAGTPTISDPGRTLVDAARKAGSEIVAIPGPSAVTAALSVSGLPADRFTFLGFLPRRGAERRRRLEEVAASRWTVVMFEAAPRLVELLRVLAESCGEGRKAVVARELTKLHEEVKCGTLLELMGYYEEHPPRGELTLLVDGTTEKIVSPDQDLARTRAAELVASGNTRKDVAALIAEEFSLPRREAYKLVCDL
jgi:16S rRNA (cytidine1402-2'-O)-methyltransferase